MFQEENPEHTHALQAIKQWPLARGELLGFALHLERTNSPITAAQIRLAVQLADARFGLLKIELAKKS
jgi:hypothetical protein